MNIFCGSLRFYTERYYHSKIWSTIMALLILPCIYAFSYRRKMTADADFLAGRPEIERFYSVNVKCLIFAIIALVIEILLFYFFCVGKDNPRGRIAVFVVGLCFVMVTVVSFTISVSHIRSDLKSTTVSELDRYVLSTKGDKYYLGFDDADVLTQIPVDKTTYEALGKGDELKDGQHSIVYSSIVDAGYGNTVEYKDKIKIEYYYHSAMLEKAELT